jgi:hypothetical protein
MTAKVGSKVNRPKLCTPAEAANGNSGRWRAGESIRQKRTNTAESTYSELAPAGYFTAVLSVFQAHLPVHDYDCHAKPLDWKARGEESDNTDPLASRSQDRLA